MQLDGQFLHLCLQPISIGQLQRIAGRAGTAVPACDGRRHLPLGAKQPGGMEPTGVKPCITCPCAPQHAMSNSAASWSLQGSSRSRSMLQSRTSNGDVKLCGRQPEESSTAQLNLPGQAGHGLEGRAGKDRTDTHVMPISFRSLSVRVRKIRRSTSCSSNTCRYFRHPISSRNVARSCSPNKTHLFTTSQQKHYHSS